MTSQQHLPGLEPPIPHYPDDGQSYYVLSFGAGINTVALMYLIQQHNFPLHHVVFADTGAETPDTYAIVTFAREFYDQAKIPFHTVQHRNTQSGLYETAQRRRVIPSVQWRWCTRDFKVKPIHRFYASLDRPVKQYIGIARDEVHRIRHGDNPRITNLYPLIDLGINRQDCQDVIAAHGGPETHKSGCYFCPFNSPSRWQQIQVRHPDLFQQALKLEENSKHFPRQRLLQQAFPNHHDLTLRAYLDRNPDPPQEHPNLPPADCGGYCMT